MLEQMDVVIASIHARYRMDEDRMTAGSCARCSTRSSRSGDTRSAFVQRRPPIPCRVEEVLDAGRRPRGVEVNGDPHRLDLEPRWLRAARARGLRFVISIDAHSVASSPTSATASRWPDAAGCAEARC